MYSEQETFNLVWEGMRSQGFKPAQDDQGKCKYRINGLKCAVGHLIPDKLYRPGMEGTGVIDLHFAEIGLEKHNCNLLIDLQGAHDGADTAEEVEQSLRGVAADWDLRMPD